MDEFRNIIGIFVDSGNKLYFDLCSEAAYRCGEKKFIRAAHKTNSGAILYIPISFVELLKRCVPNFEVKSSKSQHNIDVLKWC